MAALVPAKRVRQLNKTYDNMMRSALIGIKIYNVETGENLVAGGHWNFVKFKYIGELTASDIRSLKIIKVHNKQWLLILEVIKALGNSTREIQIQDIMFIASRRIGKTAFVGISALLCGVASPGSKILALGLQKVHGKNIIRYIKKNLSKKLWDWDEREGELRLNNQSIIRARSVNRYGDLVGDFYDIIIYDEASRYKLEVYEALSPSVIDRSGVNIIITSPLGLNWVYDKHKNKDNTDREIRESIVFMEGNIFDNPFLTKAALKRALQQANTYSKKAYREKILGEFVPSSGIAFEDFSDVNIASTSKMKSYGVVDVTRQISKYMWGQSCDYICGADFNYNPESGTIMKVGVEEDSEGNLVGSAWIVDEISIKGTVDILAEHFKKKLKALGCENPTEQAIIVIDASGHQQGVGKFIHVMDTSATVLMEAGFKVVRPQVNRKNNPPRFARADLTNRLILNYNNDVRLFVNKDCPLTIEMFKNLPLKKGVPDELSSFCHLYDATSYPLYRIFNIDYWKVFQRCLGK